MFLWRETYNVNGSSIIYFRASEKHSAILFQVATIAVCFIEHKPVPTLHSSFGKTYLQMGGDGHLFNGY